MEKWLARGAMAYCWMVIFAGSPLWLFYALGIWHFLRLERTFVYLETMNERRNTKPK